MEFWGVEVKPGEPLKCVPGLGKYVHISQAALGEVKRDKPNHVVLSVLIGGKKLVIGILAQKIPQILFDLVFENEFELSHNGKSSVYFCGYRSSMEEDEGLEEFGSDDFEDETEEESEEDSDVVPELVPNSVAVETKKVQFKAAAQKADVSKNESKPKAQRQPSKAEDTNLNEDNIEEDMSDSDKDMDYFDEETDDSEDDDESSEEEEITPKKVEVVKKRPSAFAFETPVLEKKAKLATPVGQKTGVNGNKGGHTATPHPLKQEGRTHATNKSNQQNPKFGILSCKSCNKTFNSDSALQSHIKAKHGSRK